MAKQSTGAEKASDSAAEESESRAEQSVEAFREALEKSVTISRDLLQEVVDDAVRRGRMTRGDAEELVSRLVTRGRGQAEDILGELEKLLAQVREGIEAGTAAPRRTASKAATRARRELGDATERAREEVGERAKKARKRARKPPRSKK